eukprot:3846063-Pyramimonas_sp.AAC.1
MAGPSDHDARARPSARRFPVAVRGVSARGLGAEGQGAFPPPGEARATGGPLALAARRLRAAPSGSARAHGRRI